MGPRLPCCGQRGTWPVPVTGRNAEMTPPCSHCGQEALLPLRLLPHYFNDSVWLLFTAPLTSVTWTAIKAVHRKGPSSARIFSTELFLIPTACFLGRGSAIVWESLRESSRFMFFFFLFHLPAPPPPAPTPPQTFTMLLSVFMALFLTGVFKFCFLSNLSSMWIYILSSTQKC